MEKYNEIYSLLAMLFIIVLFIAIFIIISGRLRKKGGSFNTFMLGATDEFYTKDQKKAIEIVMNKKAVKNKEQESEDPKNRKNKSSP